MIQRLRTLLEDAGVELSPEELCDVLWLAVTTSRTPADGSGDRGPAAPPARPDAAHGGDGEDPAARPGRLGPPPDGDADGTGPGPAALFTSSVPRAEGVRPARPVDVRGVRALPAARGLARALRPLRRTVPSRRGFVLDEAATADRIAESGVADVVLRPERERWLSVALVVDDGPSMVLWQRLAAEVRGLLERQGAFRAVRSYGLDSGAGREALLRARPFAPGAPPRSPGSILDPSGRTLVLVLSDGVGPGWSSGRIPRMLRGWARRSPVAVLQPLPARMWPGPGMPTERLALTAGRPAAPGRELAVRHPLLPPGLMAYQGTPLPVLELMEEQLGEWAELTAHGRGTPQLPVLLLGDEPDPPASAEPSRGAARDPGPPELSAPERLRRFRGTASPESQRLAGALAAVHPLTLPVMRLVHQSAGERAERFHPAQLAEVFLGGLLRRRDSGAHRDPDCVEYEFHPGLADLLLDAIRTPDALDTADQVSSYLMRRRGTGPEFRARLSDGGPGDATVATEARPFAAASPELLHRLGLSGTDLTENGAPRETERPATEPTESAASGPPRSHASEWVQPPLLALVRRLAADDRLPEPVTVHLDALVSQAHVRDEESGWAGVRNLAPLAEALVNAGWRDHADELREVIRAQLPRLAAAEDLESRNLRGHLALALNRLGEHDEAEEHLRAIVGISGRVHGPEHDYTLFARGYLVGLLDDARRPAAGELECRELIQTWERRRDHEHPATVLRLRVVRGRLLLDLNRPAEAEEEFRQAVRGEQERLGATHDQTLINRAWLATALQRQSRYAEAEQEMRAAVEAVRAAPLEVAPEAHGMLTVEFRLSYILSEAGRHEEAEALWSELAAETELLLGPSHWRTLHARSQHVYALRDLKRHPEAVAEAEALLEAVRAVRGDRHIEVFNMRRGLALLLDDQRRYPEAEAAYRALLREETETLGPDHSGTLTTRHNLACTRQRAGHTEESLAEFDAVLQARTRVLGPEQELTLSTRHWRATTLEKLGRLAEAEPEYRLTLQGRARALGAEHPDTLRTRRDLAGVLRDLGRHEESAREFRLLAEGRARTFGAEAELTLAAWHSLGNVLNLMHRYAEAEALNRRTLAARMSVLGAEHVATLWTRYNLAASLRGLGRLAEAEAEWRELLAVSERVLGEEHSCSAKTRQRLAELGEERGVTPD